MKHFINLKDISAKDLRKIVADAKKRKNLRKKLSTLEVDKGAPLKGKLLIQMFEKSSLRTRLSFYLAIRQLGGGTLTLRSNELHLGQGSESIADTAKILSTYGDGFMLRTDSDKKVKNFKEHLSIPVINGLSPSSHPTQVLSDIFTVEEIKKKPISFEVFADEFKEMEKQAHEINSWGKNVFVKIPITNSKGKSSKQLIKKLLSKKIKLNITAIMTVSQIKNLMSLNFKSECILSVFCGRIADSGVDPKITIKNVRKITKNKKNIKLLWASCRELYNIVEAEKTGCDIITVPNGILKKMKLFGKNLQSYSLETVRDFYRDAVSAGFKI